MESAPSIRCHPPGGSAAEAMRSGLWGYGLRAQFDSDWRVLQEYTWIMVSARRLLVWRARIAKCCRATNGTVSMPCLLEMLCDTVCTCA